MRLRAALALCAALIAPPAAGSVAEDAALAADNLAAAVEALNAASGAQDQISALTETIRAYEAGLAALREALRQSQQREGEQAGPAARGRCRAGGRRSPLLSAGRSQRNFSGRSTCTSAKCTTTL